MSVRLKSPNDYTNTVRLPDAKTTINPTDIVGAACAGQLVRNIRNNDFDNAANLLTNVKTTSLMYCS